MFQGEKVKHYRKKKGWYQSDLAERVGTTAANISQIETGKRQSTYEMQVKIADVLGVSITDLHRDDAKQKVGQYDLLLDILKEEEITEEVAIKWLKIAKQFSDNQ